MAGGAATVYAAHINTRHLKDQAFVNLRNEIIADANYLSELFRRISNAYDSNLPGMVDGWDKATTSIYSLSKVHREFASDLMSLHNFLSTADENYPSLLSQYRAASAVASHVLDDIVGHYEDSKSPYHRNPIPATTPLIRQLRTECLLYRTASNNDKASILRGMDPMNRYVTFTDQEKARILAE
ncbi:hypothetical protein GCM10010136_01970 [Limoniibacter endophyticus]|uniref:Uncharacterized protein n=1 Tax=Limoniibacter endophyticus TaxID=1565040 RepID=A0A8J3GFX4_9HYPH|nr:hypothetical protein GCM10010136_01970 [Limoniibacter endophyticus]